MVDPAAPSNPSPDNLEESVMGLGGMRLAESSEFSGSGMEEEGEEGVRRGAEPVATTRNSDDEFCIIEDREFGFTVSFFSYSVFLITATSAFCFSVSGW